MIDPKLTAASQPAPAACGICRLHEDADAIARWQIHRQGAWILRHHPLPAPLGGWLLLDAVRHLGGPAEFNPVEAAGFGPMVQRSSALVRQLTGCERVYAIAFGEGARHLHLHLIPRHAADPATEAWQVADLYRQVAAGVRPAAAAAAVQALVERARELTAAWR
ncbi:diadenosine tetraphosphate hydrolase [Synechococcus sp. Tobar12-5m-g]|uniref:diadenosine tetraphosphate hydrolase n=1 Tax=unclassified Synechococcus TaxID=2626047 RepID=UPI0020CDE280|nr:MULTISPECIES: diadenosine tetraphosphate hydrolase [unclassified Synechococcus]MCP9772353.1 diadenosine tetraphosphate hydrolase [Synechococcus sp. Tobar12-5m-g]MCP9873295.1 diadenosine tetraphosphate hydrolase [Synechococcus sp. Cruz CV-v-12]